MIEEVKSDGKLVALIVGTADIECGTHPVTDPRFSLQLLMMKRKAGHMFDKHTHEIMDRSTSILQEAIVVTKGALRITICSREGKDISVHDISSGKCLFLADGGYGIEVLEDAEFFEFKNGPHTEDKIVL